MKKLFITIFTTASIFTYGSNNNPIKNKIDYCRVEYTFIIERDLIEYTEIIPCSKVTEYKIKFRERALKEGKGDPVRLKESIDRIKKKLEI